MDLRKIGKLIAKLRNEKGLTQQELGDIVGVGFRTVSKWERGLNLPDIENINELSKIFSVTKEEILNGELKKEETHEEVTQEDNDEQNTKKKISLKIKIIISVLTILLLLITSLIVYNNNRVYVYEMKSANEEEYFIKGKLTLQGDNISILLDKLQFKDMDSSSIEIENYQYEITINQNLIFGYGSSTEGNIKKEKETINDFLSSFKIDYNGKTNLKIEEIIENKFNITLTIWDIHANEIKKNVEILLYK